MTLLRDIANRFNPFNKQFSLALLAYACTGILLVAIMDQVYVLIDLYSIPKDAQVIQTLTRAVALIYIVWPLVFIAGNFRFLWTLLDDL